MPEGLQGGHTEARTGRGGGGVEALMRWMVVTGQGLAHDRRSVSLSSQLFVPPARVPAEAAAEAHHGQDGAQQQGEGVARVVSLHRRDEAEDEQPDHRRGVRKFNFRSHVWDLPLSSCF